MSLRPYQKDAVDAAINWIKFKKSNPIIELPTGSGKSHIIAGISARCKKRIMVLSHNQKILTQDGEKIEGDVGYYCAGLGKKNSIAKVVIASVQSVANAVKKGDIDMSELGIIMVDEAHRVPPKTGKSGQYLAVLSTAKCPIIGLSASPHRSGEGYCYNSDAQEDRWFFDGVCYTVSYSSLVSQGYLSQLVCRRPGEDYISAENISINAGEYVVQELEDLMLKPESMQKALANGLNFFQGRNHILSFCTSIKHADAMAALLRENGQTAAAYHSESTVDYAQEFKDGKHRFLFSVEKVTTGFDVPIVDGIWLLRHTLSATLHMQILGRGARIADGKEDCLVGDQVGNCRVHGTLDAIIYEKEKGEKKVATAECPKCEALNPYAKKRCMSCDAAMKIKDCPRCLVKNFNVARECECGWSFGDPRAANHSIGIKEYEAGAWLDIWQTSAHRTNSKSGKPMAIVQHETGGGSIREYVGAWNFYEFKRLYKASNEKNYKAYHCQRCLSSSDWRGATNTDDGKKYYICESDFCTPEHTVCVEKMDEVSEFLTMDRKLPSRIKVHFGAKWSTILEYDFRRTDSNGPGEDPAPEPENETNISDDDLHYL